MILHLVRHPRPLIAPDVCYGRLDVAAELAAADVERLRQTLPPGLPLWSSPLQRCRALAESLAKALHATPTFDTRLAEMDFGRWEGCRWDDVPRSELDAWAADVAGYAPPGGESPRAMQARALACIREIGVPEAVVITHAGVIRTLLAHVRNLPPAEWATLHFPYASHTVLQL